MNNLTFEQLVSCLVFNRYKCIFVYNPQTKIVNCELYSYISGIGGKQNAISHGEGNNVLEAVNAAIQRAIEIEVISEAMFDFPTEDIIKEYV